MKSRQFSIQYCIIAKRRSDRRRDRRRDRDRELLFSLENDNYDYYYYYYYYYL